MKAFARFFTYFGPAIALAVAGCGGGSSSSTPTQGTTVQTSLAFADTINVNVATGQVTVTPYVSGSRTLFTGPSITYSTSILTNQAGNPGVKSTLVTLTNASTSPLGTDANGNVNGVRVLFGNFVVTGGSSSDAIQLSNATGVIPASGSGTNLPYITYPGPLAAGKTTTAQPWNFVVPAGITSFSVPVVAEADNSFLVPPNGASNAGSSTVSVRTLAGGPTLSPGYVNGLGSTARFRSASFAATDSAGNIYVTDPTNEAIRRITPVGLVSTVAGSPYNSGTMVNGSGTSATFSNPDGIAVTPDGMTIYVADTSNNAIRRIAFGGGDPTSPANWTVTNIAGGGAAGGNYSNPTNGSTATLNGPMGVAIDPSGNLFLSEYTGNRIRRMIPLGGNPALATSWEVQLVAGDPVHVNGTSGNHDGSSTSATFSLPQGIGCDRAGNVYVADSINNRIRFVTSDGVVSTLAGGVSDDSGQFGYLDGSGTTARFSQPSSVAVDSGGIVYVADTGNYRIREVSQGGSVTTLAGNGNNSQINGSGAVATFFFPTGIAVSSSGTVYVPDLYSVRLLEPINAK